MQAMKFRELENVKLLKERCDKHDEPLRQIYDGEPYCQQCAMAELKREEEEKIKQLTKESQRTRVQGYLKRKSLLHDESLKRATFDQFVASKGTEAYQNKQKSRMIAKDYLDGKHYNTLLSGDVGVGKSHLAMSILLAVNEYSDPFRRCAFISVADMINQIKNSFDDPQSRYSKQYFMTIAKEADVLVLDDIGAETGHIGTHKQATDFVNEVLYSLLNYRSTKPTIFTTNMTSKHFEQLYDDKVLSRIGRGTAINQSLITFKHTPDKRAMLDF